MEATHLTHRERRRLSIFVLGVLLTPLGILAVVACTGPYPYVFFEGLAAVAVAVPLMALVIGWPILLILGCKALVVGCMALIGLVGRWRQAPPCVPR